LGLWLYWPFGKGQLGFIKRASKKLARQIFHGMVIHGPGLQNKQLFLFRVVDIATELYVMSACISKSEQVPGSRDLVQLFCENSRRRIGNLFTELWSNSDSFKYKLAQRIADQEFSWLEEGIIKDRALRLIKNPSYQEDRLLH